jgi:hypothetical protein
MRSMFKTFLLMVPFATYAMFDGTAPASAVCYEYFVFSDTKTGNNAPRAREKARASWDKKARQRTGISSTRMNWKTAADHEWHCKQYGLFGRVACRGKARPCI